MLDPFWNTRLNIIEINKPILPLFVYCNFLIKYRTIHVLTFSEPFGVA